MCSSDLIWGACRTSEGPGFEPLISKALKCDSFEGKGTPEGIFRLGSKTTQSHESRARVFRWWWATWPDSCGAVRAHLFRRQPRADESTWAAADGWDSAIVAPRPPVTVPRLLLRARGRLRGCGTHPSVTAKSTALNAADSGRGGVSARRDEIKARAGGLFGLTWPFAFISLAFFASLAS